MDGVVPGGSLGPSALSIGHLQPFKADSGQEYVALKPIGSGKNGTVFVVLAGLGPFEGQCFALKIQRNLTTPERRKRFLAEIQFLEDGRYPGLAPLIDRGTYISGPLEYPFFVTSIYPETLRSVLTGNVPDFYSRLLFSIQLLGTLTHLSTLKRPVVHRDIKPENIFVSGRTVILGDFGLLKALSPGETIDVADQDIVTESLEKPLIRHYRTPDLVEYVTKGIALTIQSDVYQLGLVLYELFHGENPIAESDDPRSPVSLDPEKMRPLEGDFGQELDGILLRMLVTNPAVRIQAPQSLSAIRGIFDRATTRRNQDIGQAL